MVNCLWLTLVVRPLNLPLLVGNLENSLNACLGLVCYILANCTSVSLPLLHQFIWALGRGCPSGDRVKGHYTLAVGWYVVEVGC